jgi:hypothetical protein
MPICEYCGRLHQAEVPDYRFCSTNCRKEQQRYLAAEGYTSDGTPTLLDYRLTEADYLAQRLVAFSQQAAELRPEYEEELAEEVAKEKLVKIFGLLEELAQGNSVAERINTLTRPSLLLRRLA